MSINWKIRLRNKTWLLAMAAAMITFVYQACGLCGIVPPISEDMVTQFVGLVLNILVALGIIVDPTTAGVTDSRRALDYEEPREG